MQAPELLPGLEHPFFARRVKELRFSPLFTFHGWLELYKVEGLGVAMLASPIFIIGYMLSVIYRWSLKSTSIAWSPLIWIIVSSRTTGQVRFRLYEICNLAMYKTMRIYSAIVFTVFCWKVAILLGWTTLSGVTAGLSESSLILPYVAPRELPLWQVAAALSSLLAWGLYFLADAHLKAIEGGNPNRTTEATIKVQIAAIAVLRNTLALYTIACTLYITWQIAADLEWPVVEVVLFPWSR